MSELFLEAQPVRVFSCPHCAYTMNTTQSRCPSCSAAVDHTTAEEAADTLSVVDQAISDASYINIVLYTILGAATTALIWMAKMGLLGLRMGLRDTGTHDVAGLLYALGVLTAMGMCGVAVMAIRWWIRFAKFPSRDEEFLGAKRRVVFAAAVAALVAVALAVAGTAAINLALRS